MLLGIFLAGLLAISCAAEYSVPEPKFHLLKPRGFRVSIPDEPGIKLFAFHGNLNKELEQMGNGQFSQDITTKRNGKWIYENKKMKLRNGDAIYYWIFVIKNGEGFTYENGTHICKTISEMGKGAGSLKKMHVHYHHKEKRSPSWQRYEDGPHFFPHHHPVFPNFPGHRNGHNEFHHHGRFHHRFHNNGHHNRWHRHHNKDCNNSEDEDYSDEEYDNSPEIDQTTVRAPTTNAKIVKPSTTITPIPTIINTTPIPTIINTTPIPTTTQTETTTTTTTTPIPTTQTTTTSFPSIDIRFGEK